MRIGSWGIVISLLMVSILMIEPGAPLDVEDRGDADYISFESITNNYFIENKGQIDSDEILFYSHGGDVYFTPTGVIYRFREREPIKDEGEGFDPQIDRKHHRPESYHEWGVVLKYSFVGSNYVIPEGKDRCSWNTNYFKGNDPNKWHTDVPNYMEIVYQDIWDGIDLIYRLKDGAMKYDLIVYPEADPSDIRFMINGANGLLIDPRGDLVIETEYWDIIDSGLYSFYQDEPHESIPCEFNLINEFEYSFTLEVYDKSRTFVIDPFLGYSTFIGGTDHEWSESIVVDSNRSSYITGYSWDATTDYPTTSGAYDTAHNSNIDVFVTKLNPDGTSLIYSTFIGGSNNDYGYAITIDSNLNSYITGSTSSSDYPTTPGAYDRTNSGGFVTKLNSTGSSLIFSTFIKGTNQINSIAIDSMGNSFITGFTSSSDYPTTPGAYDTSHNSGDDIFVTKINPTGFSLVYSTFIGGSGNDVGYGVAIDSSGNAYIAGWTASTNYPTTPGAYDTSHNGANDVFVTKLNSSGSKLIYSTYIGGFGGDEVYGSLSIDSSGNVYIAGETLSTDFPTTNGAYDISHNGRDDVFVTKLNSTGASLSYSTFVGGSNSDTAYGIETDTRGRASITGLSSSSDYPTTSDAYDTSLDGEYDVFVTKLNSTGSSLIHSTFIGGSGFDRGCAVASDLRGNIFFTGYSDDATTDYPTTPGAFDTTPNGNYDVFVSKIDFTVLPSPPLNLNGTIGNGFINLTWDPPSNDGGADISNYNIYRGLSSDDLNLHLTLENITSFNDTTIENGVTYYYCFTAINYVGESAPSEVINIFDDEDPVFISDHSPEYATTGDPYWFSIEAVDNVEISQVKLEYNLGGKIGDIYLSPNATFPDIWTGQLLIDWFSTHPIIYYVNITDPSGNFLKAGFRQIYVLDNDEPNFIDDISDTSAINGFEFDLHFLAFDNIGIARSWVQYWYGEGDHIEFDLVKIEPGEWKGSIIIRNTTDVFHYRYYAMDAAGNLFTGEMITISTIDRTPPMLLVDITEGPPTTGELLDLMVQVKDNIGVDSVWVEYSFNGVQYQNMSMLYSGEDKWHYSVEVPISPPPRMEVSYSFKAKDTSGNWRGCSEVSLTIKDNDRPEFSDNSAEYGTTGDIFLFDLEVHDNVGVESALLSYRYGEDPVHSAVLEQDEGYSYSLELRDDYVGKLFYFLSFVDNEGNRFDVPQTSIDILDNDPPGIDMFDLTRSIGTGESFGFWVEPSDNIGMNEVRAEYWFESEVRNLVLGTDNEVRYSGTLDIPADSVTPLKIKFIISDLHSNEYTSETHTITIKDIIPPTIEPIQNLTHVVGDIVDITAVVDDNIGVDRIEWLDCPLTPTEGKLLGVINDPGTYVIEVKVYDEEGNWDSTSFVLTVEETEDKDEKEQGDLTALILVMVLIVLVALIIFLVVVLVIRNRTGKEEGSVEKGAPDQVTKQPQVPPASGPVHPPLKPVEGPLPGTLPVRSTGTHDTLPRAPSPLEGQSAYTPPSVRKPSKPLDRKQTVRGEIAPRPTNLLNPYKKEK